jgi:hypothetical protein
MGQWEQRFMKLAEIQQRYHHFLKQHGLPNADIRYHANLGRAYFVKQYAQMPFMVESFLITSYSKTIDIEPLRSRWAREYPTRVLPLSEKERELLLGVAATSGLSTAQKLRNGALVSLLMLNRPRAIWPHHIAGLERNQMHFEAGPLSGWPTNGVGAQPEIDKIKFIKFDFLETETERRKSSDPYITLDEAASTHLTEFLMNPEGWQRIRHFQSNCLFTGGAPGREGETYKPISRQGIHQLLQKLGRTAGIKGTLTALGLREPPMEYQSND